MNPIEVHSLKKYYGEKGAVDDISFFVRQGEMACWDRMVPILEGLRKRDSGAAKVLDRDPWKEGHKLHEKVGT